MEIITKRNGVALIAVLGILLVLTLLLPVMFTMSERAMETAMTGSDEQVASYLARTMVEMSVSAFQECYDAADEEKTLGGKLEDKGEYYKMDQFLNVYKNMHINDLYMYKNPSVPFPFDDPNYQKPQREANESDASYRRRCELEYAEYAKDGIIYSPVPPSGYTAEQVRNNDVPYGTQSSVTNSAGETVTGEFIGYAKCTIFYNDETEYYKTYFDENAGGYVTERITENGEQAYKTYKEKAQAAIASNSELPETEPQVFKVENKNVEFTASSVVNGRAGVRRCILVLPTKPADKNWIVPANVESNQIFPDTSLASSVKALKMNNSSYFIDGDALNGQPVYSFSCIGNMVISTKDIKYKATETDMFNILQAGESMDYNEYIERYNTQVQALNKSNREYNDAHRGEDGFVAKPYYDELINRSSDFSLGLHPETTTIKPEKDPTFNCLKTNNMRTWSKSAQKDNFVAFTATNAIQIDMPLNLIMNPCRTGRIGDGISRNKSLYKVMYLQAPTIVFNDTVNNFISLYTKTSLTALIFDYNAYRMSSVMLSAPQSTPFSYYNGQRGKTVKAGKVYFAEDAYVWLIPFAENGSNYRTQTVYYKGKDIILYKFANAGDVFMYNSEVQTEINGKMENAGFSMTGYFMDIIYNKDSTETSTAKWWQLWSGIQSMIFDSAVSGLREKTYVAEDLKWIGNMNTGAQGSPNVDDFYVIWES